MSTSAPPLYALKGVWKEYAGDGETLTILRNLDFVVRQGDSVAIVGASGSGKSTLLHLLGTLDTPTRGAVLFDDHDLSALRPLEKARLRNSAMGFVFQFHHLLPEFSTLENAAMPAIIAGKNRDEAFTLAEEALERVGLSARLNYRVTTLSGGERQRAAIARAILLKPRVLLADEPTGNLDEKTGNAVGEMLMSLNRETGMTLVTVTHNRELALLMRRRCELRAGELHE